MIRLQRGVLALMVVAITHVPAVAQSYEMSGLVAFTPSVGLDRQAPELTDLNIRGGFTWGVQGARFFTPQWGAEVVWTQQASALEVATPAGAADLYSVTLAQLQANVVYQFGDENARLRPFVFGGAGATFFARAISTPRPRRRSASAAASSIFRGRTSASADTSDTSRQGSTTILTATFAIHSAIASRGYSQSRSPAASHCVSKRLGGYWRTSSNLKRDVSDRRTSRLFLAHSSRRDLWCSGC